MMLAWTAYSEGDEYANSARWAVQPEHTKGSMWAAFCSGWSAGTRHVPSPASSSSVVQGDASGVERAHGPKCWGTTSFSDEVAHCYCGPSEDRPQPSGETREAVILKGIGKINGDGWKDTTTEGEIVFVWNAEKPAPYAPGQYPRVGNEGWSASTSQYDFTPATADDVPAIIALLSARPAPVASSDQPEQGALEVVAWPVVTDQWTETYCELTGRDPDGKQVTFVDGATVTTFRDMAKREIEAMLCAAPKAAVRAIAALTPPAEPVSRPVSCAHEAYQGRCAHCGVPIVNGFPKYPAPPAEPVSRPAGEGEREAGDYTMALAERQAFEGHTDLAAHIERMATTGRIGSMIEWDGFLRSLNAALLSPAAPDAGGGSLGPLGKEPDSALKIATDLHAAYEQLIYGLPKYLDAENLTDEENMIREAYITLDVTAHRLAALQPGGER
jgi:hypothetical protein